MKQNEITAENGQPTTNTGEIILYQPDSSIRLEVRMEEETVWLTQSQMALLFGCSQDNIGFHLKNLYAEKEIEQEATTEEISVVRFEGNRKVTRRIIHYNLDAILSVGYRVSSKNATKFRQWANSVLKEYLLRGYAVNRRIERLEQRVSKTEEQIEFFVQTARECDRFHDRFLIIDDTVYHLGASLKDLGKKLFAFNKMEIGAEVLFV